MKKAKMAAAMIASIVALGAAGCGSKELVPVMPVQNGCIVEGEQAPEWVCRLPSGPGSLVAVGKASVNALGEDFALREARADAREQLLIKLEDTLSAQMAKLLQTQRVSEASRLKIAKTASRDAAGASKTLRTWTSPSGACFVLERVGNDVVIDATVTAMKVFVKENGYDSTLLRALEEGLQKLYSNGTEKAEPFTR